MIFSCFRRSQNVRNPARRRGAEIVKRAPSDASRLIVCVARFLFSLLGLFPSLLASPHHDCPAPPGIAQARGPRRKVHAQQVGFGSACVKKSTGTGVDAGGRGGRADFGQGGAGGNSGRVPLSSCSRSPALARAACRPPRIPPPPPAGPVLLTRRRARPSSWGGRARRQVAPRAERSQQEERDLLQDGPRLAPSDQNGNLYTSFSLS